ncbi:hypothetical protein GQ457_14G000360 [Hibiscus cannabinus]
MLERIKRNANPPRVDGSSNEGIHRVVQGMEDEGKIGILQNCAIAWCKVSMGIATMARELNEAEIVGFSLMRLAGSRVLMMLSSSDTRQSVLESGVLCKWFSKVANWEPGIEIGNKRAWLSVSEIQLHVCLRGTFDNITSIWGY